MALRAVPDHPKFARLKSLLRQPKGATCGWLEMVWHFAGRFTPHGNIGKYSNIEIESWVEWEGESGALIEALVESGWLDVSIEHRLIVHDWHVHADNATKLSVKRSGKPFCIDMESTVSQQCADGVAETVTPLGLPVPEPVPVPVPEPPVASHPITPSMVAQGVLSESLLAGRELVSVLTDVVKAESKLPGYVPGDLRDAMVSAWREFEMERPRMTQYAPNAAKFFGEGYWRNKSKWPFKDGNYQSPGKMLTLLEKVRMQKAAC